MPLDSGFDLDGKLAALDQRIISGQCNAELLKWLTQKVLVHIKVSCGQRYHVPGTGLDFVRLQSVDMTSYDKLIHWYESSATAEQDRIERLQAQARQEPLPVRTLSRSNVTSHDTSTQDA